MDGYTLPPDLEQFAAEAVATGRFRDVDDVVRAGLDLVKRRELARAAFVATLDAAQRESEEAGFHELDDVLAECDDIIAEEARARG